MSTIDLLEAGTNLSKLVEQVESGVQPEIIIVHDGRPAARLVPVVSHEKPKRRLGLLEGKYPPMSLADFDASNEEIAKLFLGEDE